MTYLLAFLFLLAVFSVMAIGVVLGKRPIRGSCGGLNCELCKNPEKDCLTVPAQSHRGN